MRIALLNTPTLIDFNIEAWREFKEHGIECQVFDFVNRAKEWGPDHIILCDVADPKIKKSTGLNAFGDKIYAMVPDESYSGVETFYPDFVDSDKLAKSIHVAMIKAMTEKNPLWSEYRKDRNEFTKPKDRGMHKTDIECIKCCLYNMHHVKDRDRFERNKSKCARALVHAVCELMLLSK